MSIENIIQDVGANLLNSKAFLDQVLNVVVSPQNAEGISGWIFDIKTNEDVTLSADVTDHYTENNSFINDHVVIKPIELSLSGYIGELVYTKPQGIDAIINVIANSLTAVTAFAGEYSDGLAQAINQLIVTNLSLNAINQNINRAENMLAAFDGEDIQTIKQRNAYKELKSMMFSKQLVTVQTPWDYFENFLIKGVSFTQAEDSISYSDITITLKEIRFSDVQFTAFSEELFAPRIEEQISDIEESGINKGTKAKMESALHFTYSQARGG